MNQIKVSLPTPVRFALHPEQDILRETYDWEMVQTFAFALMLQVAREREDVTPLLDRVAKGDSNGQGFEDLRAYIADSIDHLRDIHDEK